MAVTVMPRGASARENLQRQCDDLVTAEMTRLAGRLPGLPAAQLSEVQAAIGRVIGQLVLARAHAVPHDQLAALFGLAEAPR